MRNLYFLMLVSMLYSCTKKEYADYYDKSAPEFFVSGLKNFRVDKNPFDGGRPFYDWPLSVDYRSDTPKRIHLEIENRNARMRCYLQGDNDAYPDFETNVVLYDSGAVNGRYNFILSAQKEGDSAQVFPFQVTIAGSNNCAEFISLLSLVGYSYGYISSPFPNIRTSVSAPASDTLLFHHLKGDISLITIPNCRDNTLHIPRQQIGDTTYSGGGILKYNFYPGTTLNLELYVLEEAGTWAATIGYLISSR